MQLSVKQSSRGLMLSLAHAEVARMAMERWVSVGFYSIVMVFLTDFMLGIPVTKKKFAELELSLLHLQQNVEIPETHLIIHPVIQKAVDQVSVIFRMLVHKLMLSKGACE